MSGTKRLALGLGVMALGVCGALPFRHAPPPPRPGAGQVPQNQISLGDGVALQVPGQTALVGIQTPDLQPMLSEDDQNPAVRESVDQLEMVALTPPPSLPDRYQPLYPAEPNRPAGVGRVVASGAAAKRTVKRPRVHTIHDGDTLASLALRYLGDPQRADEILQANQAVLNDPEILPIGVEIAIPRANQSSDRAVLDDAARSQPRHLEPLPSVGF